MKNATPIIAIAFQLAMSAPSMAQGCSDAGFCTVGNLKQHAADSGARTQKISFAVPIGIGDDDVVVITPGIQYDRQFNMKWSMQARVTANRASGALGNAGGPGDIFIAGTRHLASGGPWKPSITVGLKIPLNPADLDKDGLALPMQYQSSLGTTDVIVGVTVTDQRWQFSAGWQQPLSGSNRNGFLPSLWDNPDAENYPPSNEFDRKADVLTRLSYSIRPSRNVVFGAGLLAIYHIAEDTYVNLNRERVSYNGSQGLTLNATLTGRWNVSRNLTLGFSAGTPIVAREVRPDGLTRSIVFAPEATWRF